MAVSMGPDEQGSLVAELARTPLAERIESLKAGVVGAGAAGLVFGMTSLGKTGLLAFPVVALAGWQHQTEQWDWLVRGGIVILAGFLFAITYRYIIRQDHNPHLKSGAVLAFGLVRGLAQVEGQALTQRALVPALWMLAESLLVFAIARLVLDWALSRGWLQPFKSS